MGIVKISESMHAGLRAASSVFNRSINAQAEHWLRLGMLAELHPEMCYQDLCRLLAQAGDADAFFVAWREGSRESTAVQHSKIQGAEQ